MSHLRILQYENAHVKMDFRCVYLIRAPNTNATADPSGLTHSGQNNAVVKCGKTRVKTKSEQK